MGIPVGKTKRVNEEAIAAPDGVRIQGTPLRGHMTCARSRKVIDSCIHGNKLLILKRGLTFDPGGGGSPRKEYTVLSSLALKKVS